MHHRRIFKGRRLQKHSIYHPSRQRRQSRCPPLPLYPWRCIDRDLSRSRCIHLDALRADVESPQHHDMRSIGSELTHSRSWRTAASVIHTLSTIKP